MNLGLLSNMVPNLIFGAVWLFVCIGARAQSRTSADYLIAAEASHAAGSRSTSAAYTNDDSLGDVTGVSSVVSPAETMRHGYIGQLYEVTALQLSATPNTINESANRQLSASATLDDGTALHSLASSVTWSIVNGPISSISSSGLATAGAVYADTAATVQGSFSGLTGSLGLTVLETIPDNFGSYADDGLADDWQVQFFGLNHPLAGPLLDPDHDGQNNRFEFVAGLVPTDAASVFRWQISAVPGSPDQRHLVFSPRLPDRTYLIKTTESLDLPAVWSTLAPLPGDMSDNGSERTITDTVPTGEMKRFYRVEIVKP